MTNPPRLDINPGSDTTTIVGTANEPAPKKEKKAAMLRRRTEWPSK